MGDKDSSLDRTLIENKILFIHHQHLESFAKAFLIHLDLFFSDLQSILGTASSSKETANISDSHSKKL